VDSNSTGFKTVGDFFEERDFIILVSRGSRRRGTRGTYTPVCLHSRKSDSSTWNRSGKYCAEGDNFIVPREICITGYIKGCNGEEVSVPTC
jgi:hypothetical protein